MKNYFIEINENVNPKNTLHESVINFIRIFDGKTFSDVEAFQKHLTDQVQARNEKYKRCQPLQVEKWLSSSQDCITIAIRNSNANWYVHIYMNLIKGELIIN